MERRLRRSASRARLHRTLDLRDNLSIRLAHADELQSLLHKRYKLRRSTFITSNRVIADWDKYLGDSTLTTTILDRLMHRSVLVEFEGRSYRLKQAASRLAKAKDSE